VSRSIGEPLAFRAVQDAVGANVIANAELSAVALPEIELGQIPFQVLQRRSTLPRAVSWKRSASAVSYRDVTNSPGTTSLNLNHRRRQDITASAPDH
jgi:hypothetical protein